MSDVKARYAEPARVSFQADTRHCQLLGKALASLNLICSPESIKLRSLSKSSLVANSGAPGADQN